MKIPTDPKLRPNDLYLQKIVQAWEDTAIKASLDSGVLVTVVTILDHSYVSPPIQEILFEAEGHRFTSLTDLMKALSLKAFL